MSEQDAPRRWRLAAGLTIDERGGLVQVYVGESQRAFAMAGTAAEMLLTLTAAVADGVDTPDRFVEAHADRYDVGGLRFAWSVARRSGMLVQAGAAATVGWPLARRVAVIGPAGSSALDGLSRELEDLAVSTVDADADPALVIGVDDIGDDQAMVELGRQPPGIGTPWLPVQVLDRRVAVGPLVFAGDSACFECALIRRTAALVPDGVRRWGHQRVCRPGQVERRAGLKLSAVLIEAQLAHLGRNEPPPLVGRRLVHDLRTGTHRESFVLEVPGCTTCRLTDPVLA